MDTLLDAYVWRNLCDYWCYKQLNVSLQKINSSDCFLAALNQIRTEGLLFNFQNVCVDELMILSFEFKYHWDLIFLIILYNWIITVDRLIFFFQKRKNLNEE